MIEPLVKTTGGKTTSFASKDSIGSSVAGDRNSADKPTLADRRFSSMRLKMSSHNGQEEKISSSPSDILGRHNNNSNFNHSVSAKALSKFSRTLWKNISLCVALLLAH